MAGILNALGTATTLFCRGDTPLRDPMAYDATVVATLVKELAKSGVALAPRSTPAAALRVQRLSRGQGVHDDEGS